MTHHVDLDAITLKKGDHTRRGKASVCVMEAVAWWAHERHTDRPECASPVIAAFMRRWNDDLDDATRQRLKPYIPKVVGTNTGHEDDERRAWMVTDWMVRTYLPAWLTAGGMAGQAEAVAALPELADRDGWAAARPTVESAQTQAAAAWAAAWDAARAAARAAAWDAARAAARAAAWDAARAAAWAAARAAAWDAARAAARAAAWDAARAAARAAAWDAARAAAWDALKPTVLSLQDSAFDLLDRLCLVGREVAS